MMHEQVSALSAQETGYGLTRLNGRRLQDARKGKLGKPAKRLGETTCARAGAVAVSTEPWVEFYRGAHSLVCLWHEQ